MMFLRRLARHIERLPFGKDIEKILGKIHAALIALIVTLVFVILCMGITSTYFLVRLIQGA